MAWRSGDYESRRLRDWNWGGPIFFVETALQFGSQCRARSNSSSTIRTQRRKTHVSFAAPPKPHHTRNPQCDDNSARIPFSWPLQNPTVSQQNCELSEKSWLFIVSRKYLIGWRQSSLISRWLGVGIVCLDRKRKLTWFPNKIGNCSMSHRE